MVETPTALPALENIPDAAFANLPVSSDNDIISQARAAHLAWSRVRLKDRLLILRNARHAIANGCVELASSITEAATVSNRNVADSLVAEVLPLAEACRFLEREAESILQPRKLGRKGRPVWLHGVQSEVHRVPLGVVLLIAPSNYPLFLPGVQALQALAAGNAVLWKPAPGGERAARMFARMLVDAGLPERVLQIMPAEIDSGTKAISAGVDKIFLTGHADTGRAVMHQAADVLTPSVMELSGCDAVFLLPGADLTRVVEALAFGLRLNGSATCMAPRRVIASKTIIDDVVQRLLPIADTVPPAAVSTKAVRLLAEVVGDACRKGAVMVRDGQRGLNATPTLVKDVKPDDLIMRTDVFAPLLAFCAVPDERAALRAHAACPYALTAAVFGPEKQATELAAKIGAGTVLINDLIISTADPRVSFGGRGESGFGVTRGCEGLLEMTAVKTIIRQTSRSLRPYAQTGEKHIAFFTDFIQAIHSRSLAGRIASARRLMSSARKLEDSSHK